MARALPRKILAAALLLTALIAWAGVAAAQEIPTEIKPGAGVTVGGAFSAYKLDYGEQKLAGVTLYVDLNVTTHYGIEAEGRWLNMHEQSDDVHASTKLIGPRVLFDAQALHGFVPYVKVLVGDGQFNFPYGYAVGNYFVMAPGAGIDRPIGHRLSIRLIDVEYQDWPQFSYGPMHSLGASVGLSYHLF
jgi:hypothetical protein